MSANFPNAKAKKSDKDIKVLIYSIPYGNMESRTIYRYFFLDMKDHREPHDIPEASLRRLPIYYRSLKEMATAGTAQISCSELARVLGLDPTQVRKDIEMTGIVGKPRVGYHMDELVGWIEKFLGWNRAKEAILAGAGSLGSALLGYEKFRSHGMTIVAAFDVDPKKIGSHIHGREVEPLMFLPDFVRRRQIPLGIIATPAAGAHSVADLMVRGGIRAIWNFAPARLHVPKDVILQNVDLYHSLASLSYKLEGTLEWPLSGNGTK